MYDNFTDSLELHEKVSLLFKDLLLSFMERDYVMKTEFSMIDPTRSDKHLRDTALYLGVKVLQALKDSSITARKSELQEFFQRCRNFLAVACCEIKKRYDFNDPVISKLNCLTPSNALSGEFRKVVPSLVPLATNLPLLVSPEDISLLQRLDDQWRMLPLQCNRSLLGDRNASDKFWARVLQDEPDFKDLADFALSVLSLPHSNAECERVFSKINLFKTKTRNRLKTATVNGALLATESVKSSGACCKKFSPSKDMLSRMTKKELYSNVSDDDD